MIKLNWQNRGFCHVMVKLSIVLLFIFSQQLHAKHDFYAFMNEIDDAYFTDNDKKLSLLLQQDLQKKPIDELWHNYIHALIFYRKASLNLHADDTKQADINLNKALNLIKKHKGIIHKSDYMALKSSLLGFKISINPFFRGMELGSSSSKAIKYALINKSNDMRVQFFWGISLFHKPKLFGGNKNKAYARFQKAYELSKHSKTPFWGQWDVLYWHALSLLEQKKILEAEKIINRLKKKYPNNKSFQKLNELQSDL